MRAVVTGGLGFIGSHLTEQLLARGIAVTVVDNRPDGDLPKGATLIRESVTDADPSRADVIFHLAGPVGPVALMQKAGTIVPSVIDGARAAADWATSWGAPLIFASTSETYGEQPQPMGEDRPRIIAPGHSGRMEYAVAKLAAEVYLLNLPLDVRIIRPFNVAGARQSARGGFVLPRLIHQARAGEPLTVYAPGTQRRAFTHILDLVDGLIRAWMLGHRGGTWNLGNPACEASMLEIAKLVVEVTGSASPIRVVDPHDLWGPDFREAPDKVPDIKRARRELGWDPCRDLRSVVESAASDTR